MSSRERPGLRQKTLKSAIGCAGIGLHGGARVEMTLKPAPAGHGVVFRRVDLKADRDIPARWDHIVDTRLCTTIGNGAGAKVATVEHLMAALYGAEIDNALIEISGAEVPVMDGSAAPFAFLIQCAGRVEQAAPRQGIEILRPIAVEEGRKLARLVPGVGLSIDCQIDFENSMIQRQRRAIDLDPETFRVEISRARTFGFAREIEYLRANGLARGGSLDNAVVIGPDRILNQEGLRFADEFVRHKVLDCVGDLYLAGAPILGRLITERPGHALTARLVKALHATPSAWRRVDLTPARMMGAAASELREAVGD